MEPALWLQAISHTRATISPAPNFAYALAVDRINEHVSYLYEPLHPAVLRIIRWVVRSGHEAGIPVAICGEMAAEPVYAVVLLGLGLDEFSMNPLSIPKVKKVVRMLRFDESLSLVEQLFQFPTASEIECFLRSWMAKRFPEDFMECDPAESKH